MTAPSRSREPDEVRPRHVAGFREAAAAGRLPVVPPHPPRLLPGRTADQEFWRWLRRLGYAVLAYLAVAEVVERLDGLWGWVMLPLGLYGFWLAGRWMRPIGDRVLEELAAGYTTLTLVFGTFWRYPHRRHSHRGETRLPWDHRGVWVLDSRGRVKSAPDPHVEPPGFFPSPNQPGRDELWTGAAWSGRYRD